MKLRLILLTGILAFFGQRAQAQCTAAAYSTQNGATVTFYDSSYSVNGHDAYWGFGDGSGGYGTSVSHTYTANGTYMASLYIYDSLANCDDTTYLTVTITAASSCNAAFNTAVDFSNPYKINFNNTSTNAVTAYWWFGGNNSSASYNPSYTFATAGYKTVCLTTYDSFGNLCDSICQSVYVPGQTIPPSCDAYFWTSISGNTVNFYDSTSLSDIIEWSYGDGSYGYSSNPSHTYTNSGTYNACLFVYYVDTTGGDTLVCDSSCQTLTIASTSTCAASFSAYPDSLNTSASSYPVYFSNNSTGVNYLWNFGDGTSDTATNPTHTYTSAGTYAVCLYVLTAYDSLGLPIICDSTCTSITVGNAIVNCSPTMSYGVDSLNSNRYYFSGSNPPMGGYGLWEIYEGSSSTNYSGQSVTHTFSGSGAVSVIYSVYRADSSYCGGVGDSLNLSGVSCQASYYLGIDTTNLFNLYVVNSSTGTTTTTNYFWNFGDGTTSTAQYPTHQYGSFGLYNLCLTISDSISGCSSTYCDSIGLDSNGNLLKKDGFGITVVDEKDLLGTAVIDVINELSVYPNPSNGSYTIKLNLQASETVSIIAMNSLGQTVFATERNGHTGSNAYSIDMNAQPNGLYFLSLRAGNQVKNSKLYIQK
jgi:PKD repeat protein